MPKKESVTIGEFTHFKPLLKIMNTSQTKNEDNLKQKDIFKHEEDFNFNFSKAKTKDPPIRGTKD